MKILICSDYIHTQKVGNSVNSLHREMNMYCRNNWLWMASSGVVVLRGLCWISLVKLFNAKCWPEFEAQSYWAPVTTTRIFRQKVVLTDRHTLTQILTLSHEHTHWYVYLWCKKVNCIRNVLYPGCWIASCQEADPVSTRILLRWLEVKEAPVCWVVRVRQCPGGWSLWSLLITPACRRENVLNVGPLCLHISRVW